METINHIIGVVEATPWPLPHQITPIGSMAPAASVVALSALFAAPYRLAQFFATIALAILGVLVLFAPDYALVPFVMGCGLVGLVRARSKWARLQKQLDKLGRAVHELELAENRRLIEVLNSPSLQIDPRHDGPPISPNEPTEDPANPPKVHVMKSVRT
jgi:hypothetical protein